MYCEIWNSNTNQKVSHIAADLKPCLLNIKFKVHTSVLNVNSTDIISMTKT
jgi:hypothetical protein